MNKQILINSNKLQILHNISCMAIHFTTFSSNLLSLKKSENTVQNMQNIFKMPFLGSNCSDPAATETKSVYSTLSSLKNLKTVYPLHIKKNFSTLPNSGRRFK